jgi:hypothetical protein
MATIAAIENERYSIAGIGNIAAYKVNASGAFRMLAYDFLHEGEKMLDSRELDIDDYARLRSNNDRVINSKNFERIMEVEEGTLVSGDTILLANSGVWKNLYIQFDPRTEAMLDVSGGLDLINLLKLGKQETDISNLRAPEISERITRQASLRMQCQLDKRKDGFALLPEIGDAAIIAYKKG